MSTSVILHRLDYARLVVIEFAVFMAELDALRSFADLTEEFLRTQAERIAGDPSMPKDLDDEEFEGYASWYKKREDFQTTFPDILRCSLLVSAYALFENIMIQICRGIRELEGHSDALEDFPGKGIKRATVYLKKVAQVKFLDSGEAWSQLLRLGRLRNKIVHAGRTIGSDEKLRAEFNQVPGVSIDIEGMIRLDSTFIPAVVDALHAFAAQIEREFRIKKIGS